MVFYRFLKVFYLQVEMRRFYNENEKFINSKMNYKQVKMKTNAVTEKILNYTRNKRNVFLT